MATKQRYIPPAEWRQTAYDETYKSQITLVVECLRLLGWANGSTALALITVLALVMSRCENAPNIVPAVWYSSCGLVAVLFAFMAAYLAQMLLLKYFMFVESQRPAKGFPPPPYSHIISFFLAAAATCVAVGLFMIALYSAFTEIIVFRCTPN